MWRLFLVFAAVILAGCVGVSNQSPVADLNYSSSVEKNQMVLFNASLSHDPDGEIVKYLWDLGDGTKQETLDPWIEHAYEKEGNYTGKLTVIDDKKASSSKLFSIEVLKPTPAMDYAKEKGLPAGYQEKITRYFDSDEVLDNGEKTFIDYSAKLLEENILVDNEYLSDKDKKTVLEDLLKELDRNPEEIKKWISSQPKLEDYLKEEDGTLRLNTDKDIYPNYIDKNSFEFDKATLYKSRNFEIISEDIGKVKIVRNPDYYEITDYVNPLARYYILRDQGTDLPEHFYEDEFIYYNPNTGTWNVSRWKSDGEPVIARLSVYQSFKGRLQLGLYKPGEQLIYTEDNKPHLELIGLKNLTPDYATFIFLVDKDWIKKYDNKIGYERFLGTGWTIGNETEFAQSEKEDKETLGIIKNTTIDFHHLENSGMYMGFWERRFLPGEKKNLIEKYPPSFSSAIGDRIGPPDMKHMRDQLMNYILTTNVFDSKRIQ